MEPAAAKTTFEVSEIAVTHEGILTMKYFKRPAGDGVGPNQRATRQQQPPRNIAKRYSFLEDSCMSRAMDRL